MSAAEAHADTQPEADDAKASPPRLPGVPFTPETAREARKRRGKGSLPTVSDAQIEASLRRAAASDPRAAETLIRWLSRPQPVATQGNEGELSEVELEELHAGLKRLAMLPPETLASLLEGQAESAKGGGKSA
jgi:hypothetical protein